MKKIILFVLLTLLLSNISAIRSWKVYTNTSHIYDMIESNNHLYLATWGGLEVFDLETDQFIKTYTTNDGLRDLDIKTIIKNEETDTFLLGTFKSGVNRLKGDNFLLPLNDIIGLPDNNINAIVSRDSLIYVATNQGLTIFSDDETFPYPLPVNHYGTHNGLASNRVTSLVLTDDGYLLCGTDNGLSLVHTSTISNLLTWEHFHTGNSLLPDNRINSLSNNGNSFAVATRSGLVRIDDFHDQDEWTIYDSNNFPDEIVTNEILTAFLDSSHNIWFTYGIWNDNLLYIDYPGYNDDYPELNPALYAVIKISPDSEFTIWQRWQAGLFTTNIKGFAEFNNRIYAYSWGYGFFYLENNYWHNLEPNCIVASNITDIAVDLDRKIWVSNGYIGGGINRKGTRGVSSFDGFEWTNLKAEFTPMLDNRIFRISVDQRNRKWFGGWGYGLAVYEEGNSIWYLLNTDNGLPESTIGDIISDDEGNVWISNYTGGLFIYGLDAIESAAGGGSVSPITSFELFSPDEEVSDVIKIHQTGNKTFFGCRYSGIRYWDDSSFPQTHQVGDYWRKPPISQLSNTYIYDIESRENYFGEEVWIAAESGLFMYDTYLNRWYRYLTNIKREVWTGVTWQREVLYFEDEVRLYGAAPTFPTAILVDPFNRIWIGTETNGLTLYDLSTNRYTVYNMDNTPLLSNKITTLAYEPYSGNLYIGTDEGLISVEIGRLYKDTDLKLFSTIAYPNPFRPEEGETLIIANRDNQIMPEGKNQCRIYDLNGDLIISLEEDRFFKFSWDGKNSNGKKSSSGIYFYVVSSSSGNTSRGTIALIR